MNTSHTEIIVELKFACQTTSFASIIRGRRAIGHLIEKEGIDLVERLAYANLSLDDDWEFRRLGEVLATNNQDFGGDRLADYASVRIRTSPAAHRCFLFRHCGCRLNFEKTKLRVILVQSTEPW